MRKRGGRRAEHAELIWETRKSVLEDVAASWRLLPVALAGEEIQNCVLAVLWKVPFGGSKYRVAQITNVADLKEELFHCYERRRDVFSHSEVKRLFRSIVEYVNDQTKR
jgi:hypothetical protein